jgi:fluoride exporter
MRFVLVGVGGAFGSMLRYAVGLALADTTYPLATLFVNLTGSFVVGLVFSAFLGRWPVSVMTGVTVGVLGGFTTFSTFAWEGLAALQDDRVGMAAVYVVASVVGGLIAAWLGYLSGRAIHA